MSAQPQWTPGKQRGVRQCMTGGGVFTIVAVDHGAAYMGAATTEAEIVALKRALIEALGPSASAVLVDAPYGLGPAIAGALPAATGLIVAAEDGGYEDPSGRHRARLLPGWSPGKIKRLGAAAVKLFFYYDPDDAATAAVQEAWVAAVAADCRRLDIALFAEPLSYAVTGPDKRRVVVETARRISQLPVDILKLEFPLDVRHEPDEAAWRDACRELATAVDKPWVLLSAGVDFETFTRQTAVACAAGASGFMAGRAIWREATTLTGAVRARHLEQVTIPRLQTLVELTERVARPVVFDEAAAALPPGWYQEYAAL